MIQVIEYHAVQASNHVDKGTEKLEKARENKIKSLKVHFNSLEIYIGYIIMNVFIYLEKNMYFNMACCYINHFNYNYDNFIMNKFNIFKH